MFDNQYVLIDLLYMVNLSVNAGETQLEFSYYRKHIMEHEVSFKMYFKAPFYAYHCFESCVARKFTRV